MSWDKKIRGGKRRYYYRSIRVDGRSVKQYIGRGCGAALIAHLDDNARRDLKIAKLEWQSEKLQIIAADLALHQAQVHVVRLMHATLLVHGFHLHHGEWRLRK